MNLGAMRSQITIQIKTISQDSELNAVETWHDWKTIRVQAMPKTGREYYRLKTDVSEIEHLFITHYIGSVSPHMKLKFGCKVFEIIYVENVGEMNKELIIGAKAVV